MAGRGARLRRQLERQCQPISENGMIELVAKRDQSKEWLKAALVAQPYDPKKCTHLRTRVAMLTAKIEEMEQMQHMNPPVRFYDRSATGFTALAREDEIRSLERELVDLVDHRQDVLHTIEVEHEQMLARVLANVSEFERLFWLTDRQTVRSIEILDALRAKNTPLRTQVWDLQAKIKALKEPEHDESCSSNVGCNCGPMPPQPGLKAAFAKPLEEDCDPFHVGGCV